jgi:hypothetical protein
MASKPSRWAGSWRGDYFDEKAAMGTNERLHVLTDCRNESEPAGKPFVANELRSLEVAVRLLRWASRQLEVHSMLLGIADLGNTVSVMTGDRAQLDSLLCVPQHCEPSPTTSRRQDGTGA